MVLIDGLDTRDLSLNQLRDQAALVRGVDVISDTIERNISLGREGIGLREVRDALAQVELLDDVLALPDGIRTQLSGKGSPLTSTQAARLVLARALAGKPRLLILDDALAYIDEPGVRDSVCSILFPPDAPWTLICITNRQDLLDRCDRVLQLNNGSLLEETK